MAKWFLSLSALAVAVTAVFMFAPTGATRSAHTAVAVSQVGGTVSPDIIIRPIWD